MEKNASLLHLMVGHYWEMEYFVLLRSICSPSEFEAALERPDRKGMHLVLLSAACGHVSFLKSRLSVLPKVRDGKGNTPVHYAVYFNQDEVLDAILSRFPECLSWPNDAGQLPIHCGTANGASEILISAPKMLHQVEARDLQGNTPLLTSASASEATFLEVLLANGADINAVNHSGQTLLHRIVVNPSSRSLLLLQSALEKNLPLPNPNAQDHNKQTALHLACTHQSDPQFVQILLALQADVNASDSIGNRPIHYCAFYSKNELLKSLLEVENVLVAQNNDLARNALDTAAFVGNSEGVRILLENRTRADLLCQVNLQGLTSSHWRTPLHAAALSQDRETLEILASHFPLDQTDGEMKSALSLLLRFRNKALIELLLSRGAIPSSKEKEFLLAHGWKPPFVDLADRVPEVQQGTEQDPAALILPSPPDRNAFNVQEERIKELTKRLEEAEEQLQSQSQLSLSLEAQLVEAQEKLSQREAAHEVERADWELQQERAENQLLTQTRTMEHLLMASAASSKTWKERCRLAANGQEPASPQ